MQFVEVVQDPSLGLLSAEITSIWGPISTIGSTDREIRHGHDRQALIWRWQNRGPFQLTRLRAALVAGKTLDCIGCQWMQPAASASPVASRPAFQPRIHGKVRRICLMATLQPGKFRRPSGGGVVTCHQASCVHLAVCSAVVLGVREKPSGILEWAMRGGVLEAGSGGEQTGTLKSKAFTGRTYSDSGLV